MPPWLQLILKQFTRFVVRCACLPLPLRRRIAVERWIRGREQVRRLRQADCSVVSYGKSGRTWLRVLLSRFYQVHHGLPERMLIGFDNLHRECPAVPRIFFTHDNYVKDYTGSGDSKIDYRGKPVVLLVRHPGDVAVSQYFQWRHRTRPWKKDLNRYPPHGADIDIFEFMTRPDDGQLPRIVAFLNAWAAEVPENPDLLVVRYEDMRADPETVLDRILAFIRTPGTADEIRQAVEFASFENMRSLETGRAFWRSGGRMQARDPSNPDSFKVRRGKVGGYRDYLDEKQTAEVDTYIRSHLSDVFGYGAPDADRRGGVGGAS